MLRFVISGNRLQLSSQFVDSGLSLLLFRLLVISEKISPMSRPDELFLLLLVLVESTRLGSRASRESDVRDLKLRAFKHMLHVWILLDGLVLEDVLDLVPEPGPHDVLVSMEEGVRWQVLEHDREVSHLDRFGLELLVERFLLLVKPVVEPDEQENDQEI